MDEQKNASGNMAQTSDDSRKPWTTPSLRILPVPGNTRTGPFAIKDQEDTYYKKS